MIENYLLQGMEPAERVEILLSLTSIKSENIREAVRAYLVEGKSRGFAAGLNDIPEGNLTRALDKLNVVAGKIEQIKELDWKKFKDKWSNNNER